MIVYISGNKNSSESRFIYNESIYDLKDDINSIGHKHWLGKMESNEDKISLQNKIIQIINIDNYSLNDVQERYLKGFLSFIHRSLKSGEDLVWYREKRNQSGSNVLRLIKTEV